MESLEISVTVADIPINTQIEWGVADAAAQRYCDSFRC